MFHYVCLAVLYSVYGACNKINLGKIRKTALGTQRAYICVHKLIGLWNLSEKLTDIIFRCLFAVINFVKCFRGLKRFRALFVNYNRTRFFSLSQANARRTHACSLDWHSLNSIAYDLNLCTINERARKCIKKTCCILLSALWAGTTTTIKTVHLKFKCWYLKLCLNISKDAPVVVSFFRYE